MFVCEFGLRKCMSSKECVNKISKMTRDRVTFFKDTILGYRPPCVQPTTM